MTTTFPPPNYIQIQSALPGIDVYQPAPEDAGLQAEIVEFNCPQCGAATAFSAANGGLSCTHCGYYQPPQKEAVGRGAEQFEFTLETMTRSAQGWGVARKEISCQNCGAETSLPAESLTFTCAFCGSNKVVQRQPAQDILRPRFVAPFKVEPAACQHIASTWLGDSWMVPADLRQGSRLGDFIGVYLPYWTFDADARAAWKAEVGHTRTERYYQNGEWKERTVVDWRWESGDVQRHFDDLLIPGTSRVSQAHLGAIRAFDLNTLSPYSPEFLAGFQAQAYDTPLEKAWDAGRQQMREETRKTCIDQASTSQVRNFSMQLDFANESWRYILLPVYLANYTYSGRTYHAMINGQSGAIAGQRPVDWNKIWLVILLLLVPGAVLSLIGLVTLPLAGAGIVIGGIGFLLLVAGAICSIILYVRADRMDDI